VDPSRRSPGADLPADERRRGFAAPDGIIGACGASRDRGRPEQDGAKKISRDDAAHCGCKFRGCESDVNRRLRMADRAYESQRLQSVQRASKVAALKAAGGWAVKIRSTLRISAFFGNDCTDGESNP